MVTESQSYGMAELREIQSYRFAKWHKVKVAEQESCGGTKCTVIEL